MPRRFHPGDYVRVVEDFYRGNPSLKGVTFRVTQGNYEYGENWRNWSNHLLIGEHPYWVNVERVPNSDKREPTSFWEGFLELDPFLGNAWRAKQRAD